MNDQELEPIMSKQEADAKLAATTKALKDIAYMASRCPISGSGSPEGSPIRIMQLAEKTLEEIGADFKPMCGAQEKPMDNPLYRNPEYQKACEHMDEIAPQMLKEAVDERRKEQAVDNEESSAHDRVEELGEFDADLARSIQKSDNEAMQRIRNRAKGVEGDDQEPNCEDVEDSLDGSMTIQERLEDAQTEGYGVRIEWKDGSWVTGTIKYVNSRAFTIDDLPGGYTSNGIVKVTRTNCEEAYHKEDIERDLKSVRGKLLIATGALGRIHVLSPEEGERLDSNKILDIGDTAKQALKEIGAGTDD